MMRIFLGLVTILALALVASISTSSSNTPKNGTTQILVQEGTKNPWTHLKLNNGSDQFQFAVISDRTGGHREGIFAKSVERLNLLQPEFVMSVGDLIEGYANEKKSTLEWREFQSFTSRLQMPFFYVAGNHDISNKTMNQLWKEKFGATYYHFVYKNVLFLMLNTEDPPGSGKMSPEQVKYIQKTLEENNQVRWTFVFMHRPAWTNFYADKAGWLEAEKFFAGRNYTVFAGHQHRYAKFVRNNMNYYQLATTGGGSTLRGLDYGEFDHIVWVTMKKDKPVIGNVMLNSVYPENLKLVSEQETGNRPGNTPKVPVSGIVVFEGKPTSGATVVFHKMDAKGKPYRARIGDALTDKNGEFRISSEVSNDGVPAGEYAVVVVWDDIFIDSETTPTNNRLPKKYSSSDTTPLKVTVKEGQKEQVHLSLEK
jgi:predicted phosphodiesterase